MKLFTLHVQVPDNLAAVMLRNLTEATEYLVIRRQFIASISQPGTVGMDQPDLMAVIDDIGCRLSKGDSSEGYLRWAPAGWEQYYAWVAGGRQGSAPRPTHLYEVEACYRIGTLAGQGSTRTIGLRVVDH